MEFGIYLRPAKTYSNMLDLAQRAEKLKFQGAYINDHIQGFGENTHDEYLEAWTVMTGIGLATTKLRVGQIVLFNSLRNPAFLAKSIATLDVMIIFVLTFTSIIRKRVLHVQQPYIRCRHHIPIFV